jgi:hypothetical protein
MDLFSIHPYPEDSSIPPDFGHPHSTSIGIADYGKLVKLLDDAFGTSPPIVYGEYGVQTTIPASEQSAYTGTEPATTKAVDAGTQGAHEPQLERLQTGVYYADDPPKPDLVDVASAARAAETGQLKCSS